MMPVYGLSEASLAVTFSESGRPFKSKRFARQALAAEQLAVIVNDLDPSSQRIARYYVARRGIPPGNGDNMRLLNPTGTPNWFSKRPLTSTLLQPGFVVAVIDP